jgi:hypothetical protein
MEGCTVKDASEVQETLRDIVKRYLNEKPDPKIYILEDAGLLINVKNPSS